MQTTDGIPMMNRCHQKWQHLTSKGKLNCNNTWRKISAMSLDLRQHIGLKITGSELRKFHERTSILPVLFAGNKCPPAARNLIPRTPEDNICNTIYIKIQLCTLKALFQFLILHSSGHPKQELVAKGNVI